jgi:integration host factor subunit beta
MTKKEMAKAIAQDLGLPQTQVQHIVQRVFHGIVETLVEEGRIELRNFGVFAVKQRKPRQARNPRTGEELSMPGRAVVIFKAGREMAARVRQSHQIPGSAR